MRSLSPAAPSSARSKRCCRSAPPSSSSNRSQVSNQAHAAPSESYSRRARDSASSAHKTAGPLHSNPGQPPCTPSESGPHARRDVWNQPPLRQSAYPTSKASQDSDPAPSAVNRSTSTQTFDSPQQPSAPTAHPPPSNHALQPEQSPSFRSSPE